MKFLGSYVCEFLGSFKVTYINNDLPYLQGVTPMLS